MTIYIYCRVSTISQLDQGGSLSTQEAQIQRYIAANELSSDVLVVREQCSGSVAFKERAEGGKIFNDIKSGDILIASKLDRMFRNAADGLKTLEDLKERGIRLVLLDIGEINNGVGHLFFTIMAAVGEFERGRIAERIAEVKFKKRQDGEYLGGARRYGYQITEDGKEIEDAAEMWAINKIVDLRTNGVVGREIKRALDEQGIKWSLATIYNIAKRHGV